MKAKRTVILSLKKINRECEWLLEKSNLTRMSFSAHTQFFTHLPQLVICEGYGFGDGTVL
jgi:hypothetical protein